MPLPLAPPAGIKEVLYVTMYYYHYSGIIIGAIIMITIALLLLLSLVLLLLLSLLSLSLLYGAPGRRPATPSPWVFKGGAVDGGSII